MNLDEIISGLSEPEETGVENELPICLISVDVRHNAHLIKIMNEDKVNEFFSSTDFYEYFDNEYWEDYEPGIYKATCNVRSWQDNTPDGCDWNSELIYVDTEEVEIISKQ